MADAISLATIGAAALTEGIKFLYEQAGELLRRRRERARMEPVQSTPPTVAEPAVLPAADLARLEALETQLRALRTDLHGYASEVDPIDPSDQWLVHRVDALRRVLEVIYRSPLVFEGEPVGAEVRGRVDVDEVAGYVAAVRADGTATDQVGGIEGTARVRRVESGGQVIGVELGDHPGS